MKFAFHFFCWISALKFDYTNEQTSENWRTKIDVFCPHDGGVRQKWMKMETC